MNNMNKHSILSLIIAISAMLHTYAVDNVLAKTLYAEARSEGPDGIRHVATVIYNRSNATYNNVATECLKPKQFSCWNNKADIIVNVPAVNYNPNAHWNDAQAWAFCKLVEHEMRSGAFIPLGGWTHYAVNNCKARWFKMMTNRKTFKRHTFGNI